MKCYFCGNDATQMKGIKDSAHYVAHMDPDSDNPTKEETREYYKWLGVCSDERCNFKAMKKIFGQN